MGYSTCCLARASSADEGRSILSPASRCSLSCHIMSHNTTTHVRANKNVPTLNETCPQTTNNPQQSISSGLVSLQYSRLDRVSAQGFDVSCRLTLFFAHGVRCAVTDDCCVCSLLVLVEGMIVRESRTLQCSRASDESESNIGQKPASREVVGTWERSSISSSRCCKPAERGRFN